MKLTRLQLIKLIEQELNSVVSEDEINEASKCTGPTKKASSTSKGKKWMKCVRQPDGKYRRVHWGQSGVRVTGKSGNTKRKKSFKALYLLIRQLFLDNLYVKTFSLKEISKILSLQSKMMRLLSLTF